MPDHPSTSPQGRRILVAGAATPVGRAVVERLLAAGHPVVAVSPGLAPAAAPGLVQVDAVVAGEAWPRWCAGCAAAVNVPEESREGRSARRAAAHRAADRVVKTCAAAGIPRLVHVCAPGTGPGPAEETVRASGLRWTILRPVAVFGPGTAFDAMLRALVGRRSVVPVVGPGTAALQPVAADDVARIALAALDLPGAEGLSAALGGPERLSVDELIRRTAAAMGVRRAIVHLPVGPGRTLVRLRERLGRPRITAEELDVLLAGATCEGETAAAGLGEAVTRLGGRNGSSPAR